jgi:hypothetical protein
MISEKCPGCGKMLEVDTAVKNPEAMPQPKDLSVCLYCGVILEFDDTLHRIALSKEQIGKLEPEVRAEVLEIQQVIWQRIERNRVVS